MRCSISLRADDANATQTCMTAAAASGGASGVVVCPIRTFRTCMSHNEGSGLATELSVNEAFLEIKIADLRTVEGDHVLHRDDLEPGVTAMHSNQGIRDDVCSNGGSRRKQTERQIVKDLPLFRALRTIQREVLHRIAEHNP